MQCPFCASYDVSRMFVGSRAADWCECVVCGSGWEESVVTGATRRRPSSASVVIPDDETAESAS